MAKPIDDYITSDSPEEEDKNQRIYDMLTDDDDYKEAALDYLLDAAKKEGEKDG